jgi:hypothetical protein
MNKKPPASEFWTYGAECVHLLHWAYFKPYTFARWLRDIHPELKPTDNPFAKRAEFRTNLRLRRYAGQVWWLSAVVPLVAALLVGLVYPLASHQPFDWFRSCLFLLGWYVGLLFTRGAPHSKLRHMGGWFVFILFILLSLRNAGWTPKILITWGDRELLVELSQLITTLAPGVAAGVAAGMAAGVAAGVALGVTLGVAFGMPEGILLGIALGVAWILGILRVYFWLPELLWMLILFLLSRSGDATRWLRYLPARFDERIILPLPFVDRIIVEAYRENPSTAREAIAYLITSTNQQKVAAQAIASIAVDSLKRCQSQMNIANITDELAWIPSLPPKELGFVLPKLLDISHDVRASVEATSPYRQSELLTPPITALRELLKSLAFSKNARLATNFGSIAQRWLAILETAQRSLEEQARYSPEIPQVYITDNALDPQTAKNRFKGRIDLFREIETLALAEQPPVLLLYGGHRTGKTSTLKYLPHRVGANLVPLLMDVQAAASTTTLPGLAENLATQIIEAARRLPQHLDLSSPDKNKLAQDPFSALQEWLAEIEWTVPSRRFLLCLDEFERLSGVVEATGSRAPLNFLGNVLQHRTAWTLLFSGSHEPKELPDDWSDYLINTRTLRVSYLDEDSARELIVHPVEDFPDIYSSTAIDAIIHLTRCQPYLVQLTCHEVVERLNHDIRENRRDTSTAKATARDVETVIPTVLERGGEYFGELWKSLTDSDRHVLRRLIQGETPTAQDKAVLRKLERQEILEKTASGYSFQVPLVREYVEQVVEEEE